MTRDWIKGHSRIICWAVFLLITGIPLVIMTLINGGPKIFLFLIETPKSVEGSAVGCEPGKKFQYTYQIDKQIYEFSPSLSAPCKSSIPSGRKLKIFYLPSDPRVSWASASSNPRKELSLFLLTIAILALFASGWCFYWINRHQGKQKHE